MQDLHRRCFPAMLALLVAVALVPLGPHVAAADSDYAASCAVRLRDSPSTSATSLVTMPTGTIVTVTDTVAGGAWSATCGTSVSGSTWYAITAIDGTSVTSLYGVSVAYAAAGLFQPSASPPPTPAVYLEGIDVSQYQGTIDWAQVAGSGKRFAIMRATLGQTYLDPTYAVNHAGARAAGLQVTAYHFATPSSSPGDALLEADWFVQNAALLPGDLVPALDVEQAGGLSATDLQAWVGTWLGEVSAKLGVRPMIYTSPTFWRNSMGDTTMFADQGYGVLWVAHWFVSKPTIPAAGWGGHGWTFWQYSNCGSVAGIPGCVDLDRYNGSDLTGVAFDYSPLQPAGPAVAPANPPPTLVAITPATVAAGGGDLTVSIQGAAFAPGVSTAYWNATPLATTYVSPTQLTAVVPASLVAVPGTGSVMVFNQPPGGGSSAPALLTVTPPPPLAKLELRAASALGVKPASGYTATTPKIQAIGKAVTWTFRGGATLAGQRVNVLVARKVGGAWGNPVYARSAWADAGGTVTFWYRSPTAAAINVRVQWPGSAGYAASTSRALSAYWR